MSNPRRPLSPLLRWSIGAGLAILVGALIFEAFDFPVFQRIGLAHEQCYLREPRLVWLHVISDALIGLAYVAISSTLAYLVYKAARDIPFNWVFLAFGLFIVSCGLTHFLEVWVIWDPVYWLSGYVKVVTAVASLATAVVLLKLVPKIFQLIDTARRSEARRAEIEQLNDELERFNYTVAHDLRAPLRGIAGFSQALREDFGPQLPPKARDYLEKMQRSVAQMDNLILELLKYATIGRQALEPAAIRLDDVVRGVQALLEAEIRERDARIEIAAPLPVVRGDATLLQVAFLNLLGNAIRFVARGTQPQVAISAQTDGTRVRLFVDDNGLGLPEDAREKIFQMFERFHPGYSGTGIGLAIVQRAVQRLEGQVGVEPAPGGRGTRFWIELPLA